MLGNDTALNVTLDQLCPSDIGLQVKYLTLLQYYVYLFICIPTTSVLKGQINIHVVPIYSGTTL